MGGVSKWNVLTDENLSKTMPEVFDPPPEIIAGFMAQEVDQALLKWNPLVWGVIMKRGLFVAGAPEVVRPRQPPAGPQKQLARRLLTFLRRTVFDRFGRS
jgi:tRNA(adenine34) deaminase